MSIDNRYWSRHDDDTVVGRAWGRAPVFMRVHEILPQPDDTLRPSRLLTDVEKQEFIALFLATANRMGDPALHPAQRRLLDHCRAVAAKTGRVPTGPEILAQTGLSKATVYDGLKLLVALDLLRVRGGFEGEWTARLRVPAPRKASDHVKAPAQ